LIQINNAPGRALTIQPGSPMRANDTKLGRYHGSNHKTP
jgi:hypothetical protein